MVDYIKGGKMDKENEEEDKKIREYGKETLVLEGDDIAYTIGELVSAAQELYYLRKQPEFKHPDEPVYDQINTLITDIVRDGHALDDPKAKLNADIDHVKDMVKERKAFLIDAIYGSCLDLRGFDAFSNEEKQLMKHIIIELRKGSKK